MEALRLADLKRQALSQVFPDALGVPTILRFRHLLEQHRLSEQIFALVRGLLESKRLLLKSGTIVDATIIDAPPSTKNEAQARDPEMKQGKKNSREWQKRSSRTRSNRTTAPKTCLTTFQTT